MVPSRSISERARAGAFLCSLQAAPGRRSVFGNVDGKICSWPYPGKNSAPPITTDYSQFIERDAEPDPRLARCNTCIESMSVRGQSRRRAHSACQG